MYKQHKETADRIKERLEAVKYANNLDSYILLPFSLYPYKCLMCGKSLLPDWVEADIKRDVAYFDANNKLYDVCVVCGGKLGLISKQDLYNELKGGE